MSRTPINRQTPRISVNDLALYIMSSDTARMTVPLKEASGAAERTKK
jgi:hypothetical protein